MFCSYVFEEFYTGNVTLKLSKMPSGLSRALVCVFLFLCVRVCVCVCNLPANCCIHILVLARHPGGGATNSLILILLWF